MFFEKIAILLSSLTLLIAEDTQTMKSIPAISAIQVIPAVPAITAIPAIPAISAIQVIPAVPAITAIPAIPAIPAITFTQTCNVYEGDLLITKLCNEIFERCCSTGCCSKYKFKFELKPTSTGSRHSVLYWVLVIIALCLKFYIICKRVCFREDESSTECDNTVTSPSQDDSPRPPTVSLDLSSAICPEINPGAPQESTQRSVTPPPDYNSALAAPFLYPDNTIPSYEDAMAAEWKKKSVPGRNDPFSETDR